MALAPARRLTARALVALLTALLSAGCGAGHPRTTMSPTTAAPAVPSPATIATHSVQALSSASTATRLDGLTALTRRVIDSDIERSGPGDPRFWADGSFQATDGLPCWFCYDTAATTAAVLSEELGTPDAARLRSIAETTYTTAIAEHQLPSGEIEELGQPDSVGTTFFMAALGTAALELRHQLSPGLRRIWGAALVRGADWLLASGSATYYINGNVNLREAEDFWLSWAFTGQRRFHAQYARELAFAEHPGGRFADDGLKLRGGSEALSPDAAGYFTEGDPGGPSGFDPSYTLAQLGDATNLYVLTHSARVLALVNLLFDQVKPRVDSQFVLDAHDGTRQNDTVAFTTPAVAVLVLSGARPGLASYWSAQVRATEATYTAAMSYSSENIYKGLFYDLSVPALAVQWPHGILAAPCRPQSSRACAQLFGD